MKHTNGPWTVARDEQTTAWSLVGPLKTDAHGNYKSGTIAAQTFAPTLGEAEENAKLIAAAPDLLDALKIAIGWLRRIEKDYPGSLNDDAIQKHLEPAIEKVYGRDETSRSVSFKEK